MSAAAWLVLPLLLGGGPTVDVQGPGARALRTAIEKAVALVPDAPEASAVEAEVGAGKHPQVVLTVRAAGSARVLRYRVHSPRELRVLPPAVARQLQRALRPESAAESDVPTLAAGEGEVAAPPKRAEPSSSAMAPTADAPRDSAPAPERHTSFWRTDEDEQESQLVAHADSAPRAPGETPWLRLDAGARLFTRRFRYTDDLFHTLPTYQLPAGPSAVVDAEVFPWDNVGFAATGEWGFVIASASPVASYTTKTASYGGELKARLTLGRLEPFASAGYAWHDFVIQNPAGAPPPGVPGVTYSGPRAELGARWGFSPRLWLDALGGYQYLLSAGEIGSAAYFPRQRSGGVDASVGVSVKVASAVVRASAEYRRYFFTLNPQPGDALVAGGALDEYWSGTLSVGWAQW